MPPSRAMSNQSAPSVRQHPPGLVCSLLASAACHGLALAVCLPSTFFPPAWHADALSLSGSASVSASALFFFHPTLTKPLKSNGWTDYLRKGKVKKIKKLKSKRNFCWQENKVKSNLSSCLFFGLFRGVLFFFLPLSDFFPCAYFHQTHSCCT